MFFHRYIRINFSLKAKILIINELLQPRIIKGKGSTFQQQIMQRVTLKQEKEDAYEYI